MKKKSLVIIAVVLLIIVVSAWFLFSKGVFRFNVAFDFFVPFGEQYLTYTGVNYKFDYPNDWIFSSDNNVITISGPESTEEFYVTINLQVLSNAEYSSKEDVAGGIVSQIMDYDSNAVVSNNIMTSLGGEVAGQFDVSYNLEGQAQKARYVVAEHNNDFYTLSFQAPRDIFDKYVGLFEHARNSFKFLTSNDESINEENQFLPSNESSDENINEGSAEVSDVQESSGCVITSFDGLGAPRGLAWDGSHLWVSDEDKRGGKSYGDYIVYKLNPNTGNIVFSFSPYTGYGGLAWDGTYLWGMVEGYVHKLDPSSGEMISYLDESSLVFPEGLCWDGEYLWTSTYIGDDMIYKISPVSGEVLLSYSFPGDVVHDLAYDGSFLWAVDAGSNKVYKINPVNGEVILSFSIKNAEGSEVPSLSGLAWDGSYLWVSSDAWNKIYQVDVNKC